MTSIDEMDEFFNFEDAAQLGQQDPSFGSGPFELDLALDPSFSQYQQYGQTLDGQHATGSFDHIFQDQTVNGLQDTAMMGASDFMDFPRWIDGMDIPTNPCTDCAAKKTHCKVIKEGQWKGSCTSCVALALGSVCSLRTQEFRENRAQAMGRGPHYMGCIPTSADESEEHIDMANWTGHEKNPTAAQIQTTHSMENLTEASRNHSATSLKTTGSSNERSAEATPKVGARFSRDSLRILKLWLSNHAAHPYPTDDEKDGLKAQTGLNKTQITNWLANARRRGKVRAPRSTSPGPQHYLNGIDIPRRATPRLQEMNPLERWKHSPPENEPASVSAIAKAVSSSAYSSGHNSSHSYNNTDDGSARSLFNASSASSFGTSNSSSASFASAFSHKSRGSFGSFSSMGLNSRGRRRRRRQTNKPTQAANTYPTTPRTFQCTFCTESFKTKHDWQRHEKSLHLSLERWVCSPKGAVQFNTELNAPACVYCGMANPPDEHAEQHNHSSCTERTLEERTFYRKDHLRQHLNLVHEAKFQCWSMDSWKSATPEIRSRCGFCGIAMDSWSIRVDHLAEHFKSGKSMADWKGDWGFASHVLDNVENGMPPYLIHDERNTMQPFSTSNRDTINAWETLEDKVKMDLVTYINTRYISGTLPTDEDLLQEARQTILKEEALADSPKDTEVSWFRDLIMLSGESPRRRPSEDDLLADPEFTKLSWAERLDRTAARHQTTMIDMNTIKCEKERKLKEYVKLRQGIGLTPIDTELQIEACKILDQVETTCNYKCKGALQWFKYLITTSTNWLSEFRRRALLPRSDQMAQMHIRSLDDTTIDYSIHNYHRLERELKEFVAKQRSTGYTPTDADLQRTARMIIFENDDPWNQTAADDPNYLVAFKRQNGLLEPIVEEDLSLPEPTVVGAFGLSLLSSPDSGSQLENCPSPPSLHWDLSGTCVGFGSSPASSDNRVDGQKSKNPSPTVSPTNEAPIHTTSVSQPSANTNPTMPLRYFLNDSNCYGRLVHELSRFVTSCMSPNNPNQHTPTDGEIQNQARWIIYDDDDPWNQTAADNDEWLIRFKRDRGLLPSSSGPGLPVAETSWQVSEGGSGYSPPYLMPGKDRKMGEYNDDVDVRLDDGHYVKVRKETASNYVKSMSTRFQPPAQVFCSRELENHLQQLISQGMATGVLPTDDQLRAKAREVLGVDKTAADDVELLEKFKALHGMPTQIPSSGPLEDFRLPNFNDEVSMLAVFDQELSAMDLSSFSTGDVMNVSPTSDMADLTFSPQPEPFQFETLSPQRMEGIDNFDDVLGLLEDNSSTTQTTPSSANTPNEIAPIATKGDISYADIHRVMGATASPLRRRASERLAQTIAPVPVSPTVKKW